MVDKATCLLYRNFIVQFGNTLSKIHSPRIHKDRQTYSNSHKGRRHLNNLAIYNILHRNFVIAPAADTDDYDSYDDDDVEGSNAVGIFELW